MTLHNSMYLCTVTIILVAIIKMEITYINGFISEACLRGLKDFEQVRDAIIVVKCEGGTIQRKSNGYGKRCYCSYPQSFVF